MRNWLKQGQTTALPDPEKEKDIEKLAIVKAANKSINLVGLSVDDENVSTSRPTSTPPHAKKRGDYKSYTPELRFSIGRYALEHGLINAVKFFKRTSRTLIFRLALYNQ